MSKKISQLSPAQLPLNGNEKVPIVQNNQTVQCELSSIQVGSTKIDLLSSRVNVLSASKVDTMMDVLSAPTSTVSSITITGGFWSGETLIQAFPTDPEDPYADTDGRQPFTLDGTWDNGAFYDLYFWYDTSSQVWKLNGNIDSETTSYYTSDSADPTAQNNSAWGWTPGPGLADTPSFINSYTPSITGVPGTKYRVRVENGLFEHYELQPDKSIILAGVFDALGNEYTSGTIIRKIAAENWEDVVPLLNEIVLVGDTGCTAVGDGEKSVKYLKWNGLYRVNFNETFTESPACEIVSGGTGAVIICNSGDIEIEITDDIPALGITDFEIWDYSRDIPGDTRFQPVNIKYAIKCSVAQTGGIIKFNAYLRYPPSSGDWAEMDSGSFIFGMSYGVIYTSPGLVLSGV